jgi:hypothetical protein
MVTMSKGSRTKQVDAKDVNAQVKNGWVVSNGEVRAVLKPAKKNAEETPAVEEASSEQGDDEAITEGD